MSAEWKYHERVKRAEAGRAHPLQLPLALQQALGLNLEALDDAPGRSHRPRVPPAASPALGSRLAAQAPELNADRSAPVFELEILGDVLDRNVRVVPHAPDVGKLLAHVHEPLFGLLPGQALLELAERPLHHP